MKRIVFLLIFFVLMSFDVFAGDYVIGDGDSFQISVWGSPELSLSAQVRPDGKISIPALLDEITVRGMTPMELTAFLEEELKKVVKTPIVSVIMSGMSNYRIFIFGKGAPAGVRTLNRETTLLEFLCQLGSLPNADLESSYLVRNKKKIKTDFSELFEKGDFSQDIVLEPDDMLFIPDNFEKRINIVGAIGSPTTIPFRKGLTILDIILSVGGFTEFANKNNVQMLRNTEGGERMKISIRVKDIMKGELDKNIKIMPGDFIVVKETLF
ncbi:MAG: polysaccharide biosynthesis/export family protein [Thermodesulfovibrionia bacterium]|nr:polysaccharide biosynthesis/export family protein [Thermodesulfovibrionia bacterium]